MPSTTFDKNQVSDHILPGSSGDAVPVITSDVVGGNFASMPNKLYVGVAGDVTLVMRSGNVALFKNVPAGTVLQVRPLRVNTTGTTATNLLALYDF